MNLTMKIQNWQFDLLVLFSFHWVEYDQTILTEFIGMTHIDKILSISVSF